jgi:penicillin-binding protein 1A
MTNDSPSLMAASTKNSQGVRYAPRVISGEIAFLMRNALHTAVYGEKGLGWKGTSWKLGNEIKRADVGGKTGTTNNSKVTWYAGFGSNLVTTVYVGFDDNKRTLGKSETGANTAMPAWKQYMKTALSDKPVREEVIPPNIITVKIDTSSGYLGSGKSEYFIKGTEPTKRYIVERAYTPAAPQPASAPKVAPAAPKREQHQAEKMRLGLPPPGVLKANGAELF